MNIEQIRTKIRQYPLVALAIALVLGGIISISFTSLTRPENRVLFQQAELFACLTSTDSDGDQSCTKYKYSPAPIENRGIASNAACPSPLFSCP